MEGGGLSQDVTEKPGPRGAKCVTEEVAEMRDEDGRSEVAGVRGECDDTRLRGVGVAAGFIGESATPGGEDLVKL